MRLTKEERYQLKLIRLANEILRSGSFDASYGYKPWVGFIPHSFYVLNPLCEFVIYETGFKTAESCYKWAVAECKKKGLIR